MPAMFVYLFTLPWLFIRLWAVDLLKPNSVYVSTALHPLIQDLWRCAQRIFILKTLSADSHPQLWEGDTDHCHYIFIKPQVHIFVILSKSLGIISFYMIVPGAYFKKDQGSFTDLITPSLYYLYIRRLVSQGCGGLPCLSTWWTMESTRKKAAVNTCDGLELS